MSALPKQVAGYIPEFETLRAIAALGVMACHFEASHGIPFVANIERRLGYVGVDLFFALSGFLITGILLQCKSLLGVQSVGVLLRQFYARRFLRIFPLYYFAIALVAIFLNPAIRQNLVWFLTYTVNYGKIIQPTGWVPLHHFWTLAVEEQFYIVWPILVFLCSSRAIVRICIVVSILSFCSRLLLISMDASVPAITQPTHCCLEPLALGAVFAVLRAEERFALRFARASLMLGGIASMWLVCFASNQVMLMCFRVASGFCFSAMMYLVALRTGSAALGWLRLPPFLYLGKISYGLYVWHVPVAWYFTLKPVVYPEWLPRGTDRILNFLILCGLSIATSAISWHLFERPINNLKRRFPYRVKVPPRESPEPAPVAAAPGDSK